MSVTGMLQVGEVAETPEVMPQVKLTMPLNPPVGVTVMVEVVLDAVPSATVAAVPEIWKLGDGRLMVYVAVAMDDCMKPAARATALIVCDAETVTGLR